MANCPVTVPAYIEMDCFHFDKSRIIAVAFIDEGKVFSNITNPVEWASETYAATILIHKQVKGSYPPAAVVEQPGYGLQAVRNVGRNHAINFRVPSVKGNELYWDALNKSESYKFAFVTGDYQTGILWYVNQIVSINAVPEVPEGLDAQIDWVVDIKWSSINLPRTYDVPYGTFTP